ncbi:MAG TPA: M14 family zinc carboxypeptidase [Saprospiraceae bacterium]|nr:M14 family zinc carboxypeptidase [Saprospiraceae bacterium]
MIRPLYLIVIFLLSTVLGYSQLQSPDDFLPHKNGEQFTPHYMLADYARHVAENSPLVTWSQYGWTNEKRPLQLLTIASEENLARIEAIRENNLRRAGLLAGETDPELDDIAIVWLSFGVHGNETAGPESSIPLLYHLGNPENREVQEWLESVVILFDPSINPDGYARYSHWYRRVAGKYNDPRPYARSHREPWPGGRTNHYFFDLNRDWAWQTQIESQQRMEKYNSWLPHIHVDFHEQGINSPYYFAPAAKPYHEYIRQWQRDFQYTIGKNHAKYFDEKGWLYFTRERFDLLYPSYGDTYPTYNGAIGMTYEQGGSGRAGRGVLMENGDTLTLKDRVSHHVTTGLSTVEITAKNASEVVENFVKFYEETTNNPPGDFKTFVIKGDNPPERLRAFLGVLDKNGIQYGRSGKTGRFSAYNYQNGEDTNLSIGENDLVITAFQPKAMLTQILLEPETYVEDSLTYDITAWSLPYAYGLEAYASTQRFLPTGEYQLPEVSNNVNEVDNAYAYLASWRALQNAQFLAALNKKGIKARYAQEGFEIEDKSYPAGTIVLTRADNRKMGPSFDAAVAELATEFQQEIEAVKTGFAQTGSDFGSGNYVYIKIPKILVLSGEQTSSQSFGQVWYYLENALDYPHTIIDADQLGRIPMDDFNLLIMPEGRYRFGESTMNSLLDWTRDGGRVIAIGRAIDALQGEKGFRLQDQTDNGADRTAMEDTAEPEPFGGQSRRYAAYAIPGAIFKVTLDETHPLAFGLGDHYFTLKTGTGAYPFQDNVWNVGRIGENLYSHGFVGHRAGEAVKNTLVFGVEDQGRGAVIYMVDNPLYRAFWHQGHFLFSNAVFLAGQ